MPGYSPPSDAPGEAGASGARRPRELQDALNHYLFHPVARRLAILLMRTRVTPNMVSAAGGLLVVCAGLAYAQPGWPGPAFAGLALHLGWHVLDGADGDLARLTGRSSPRGELIDGIADYAGHIVLYLIMGWVLQAAIGPMAWLFAVGAGISRVAQANHYEVQRRQYQWWVYEQPWLGSTLDNNTASEAGGWLGAAYLMLARRLAPHARAADAAVMATRASQDGSAKVRAALRQQAKPMLRSLSLLGANYRTIVLGLSMIAGSPLYFFLYEAVFLNLILFRSIRICDHSARILVARLGHAAASTRR